MQVPEAERILAKRIAWSDLRVPLATVGRSRLDAGAGPPGDGPLYLIASVQRGTLQCGEVSVGAGCAILAPPGAAVIAANAVAVVHARFRIALTTAIDPLAGLDLPIVVGAGEARAQWEALATAGATPEPGRIWARVRARGLVIELLAALLESAVRDRSLRLRPQGPDWLCAALDALEKRLGDRRLDVAALARAARLSPSHFAHRFRAAVGTAPRTFLRQRRIERARTLLEERPDLSIKEIAGECGFPDALRFARAFRAQIGETPSRWRISG